MPQSGIVVVPTSTAPAAENRSTTGESALGTRGVAPAEPDLNGTPARARFSLTVTGMPSSGPNGIPAAKRRSDAAAARSAAATRSGERSARALTAGSSSAMRAATVALTSTGDTSRER